MSYRDQIKYFEKLKFYERKMESKDLQVYKSLLKRHKDDEDLDKLSMQKLINLHEKYYVNRPRKNFDNIFKKKDDPS